MNPMWNVDQQSNDSHLDKAVSSDTPRLSAPPSGSGGGVEVKELGNVVVEQNPTDTGVDAVETTKIAGNTEYSLPSVIISRLLRRGPLIVIVLILVVYGIFMLVADFSAGGSCSASYDDGSYAYCTANCPNYFGECFRSSTTTNTTNSTPVTFVYQFSCPNSYTSYISVSSYNYSAVYSSSCYAELRDSCANIIYLVVPISGFYLAFAVLCQIVWAFLYSDFDPQVELVLISLSYSLNAAKITALLHPVICLYSLLEASYLLILYYLIFNLYLWKKVPNFGVAPSKTTIVVLLTTSMAGVSKVFSMPWPVWCSTLL